MLAVAFDLKVDDTRAHHPKGVSAERRQRASRQEQPHAKGEGRLLKQAEARRYIADYEGAPTELGDAQELVSQAEAFVAATRASFLPHGSEPRPAAQEAERYCQPLAHGSVIGATAGCMRTQGNEQQRLRALFFA